MKRFFSSLLSFLFPREHRAHRLLRISEAELTPLLKLRKETLHDMEISTLFSYKDPLVREVIWALKYDGSRHAAALLGNLLSDVLLEELAEDALFADRSPLLIPIPLSSQRERARGYNQVHWIAEETRSVGAPLDLRNDILTRVRETAPQTTLPRTERLENVRDAFAVSDSPLVSKRICIILDDVTTTGSTLYEARRALLDAGATDVRCIALARAE